MTSSGMAVSVRSYGAAVSRHAHAFHQVVLPLSGSMEIRVGDAAGRVAERCGVMVPGGTTHSFRADGENRFVVLDLPEIAILPEPIRSAFASPFFRIGEAAGHLMRYIACARLGPAASVDAAALLAEAIGLGQRPQRRGAIGRALAIIETRYAEPLTIGDLSQAVGMSISSFHERFREAVGRSPAEHLAETRLDQAEALLHRSDMPIAEIALAVGYSDQTALTRSFRHRRGTTPGALRRN
jgi:AraC-like DNA-binding protein